MNSTLLISLYVVYAENGTVLDHKPDRAKASRHSPLYPSDFVSQTASCLFCYCEQCAIRNVRPPKLASLKAPTSFPHSQLKPPYHQSNAVHLQLDRRLASCCEATSPAAGIVVKMYCSCQFCASSSFAPSSVSFIACRVICLDMSTEAISYKL